MLLCLVSVTSLQILITDHYKKLDTFVGPDTCKDIPPLKRYNYQFTLLCSAKLLFWNYQPFYIPPSFILRFERCHLHHPAFLKESQVASIQPFSCLPEFANASVGRKVLNMRNLSWGGTLH